MANLKDYWHVLQISYFAAASNVISVPLQFDACAEYPALLHDNFRDSRGVPQLHTGRR